MPHRPIREIVESQQLYTVAGATSVFDAAKSMLEARIGALIVEERGEVAGIFTERDALYRVIAAGLDPKSTRVDAVMTEKPVSIEPSRPFGHALHMMHEGGFRHVPVVEAGKLVGMVSARDALGPELSEFASELEAREHIGEILG